MKVILYLMFFASPQTDLPWYATIAEYVETCRSVSETRKLEAATTALQMLSIERSIGIPEHMLGMSLAAACVESGFVSNAEGDHKFSRNGKPKAIGVLQLWPWVERYGVDRRNIASSTKFWVSHVVNIGAKTRKLCKPRNERLAWKQAWVTAVRAPSKNGRCRQTPKHWKKFLKLRSILEKYEVRHDQA